MRVPLGPHLLQQGRRGVPLRDHRLGILPPAQQHRPALPDAGHAVYALDRQAAPGDLIGLPSAHAPADTVRLAVPLRQYAHRKPLILGQQPVAVPLRAHPQQHHRPVPQHAKAAPAGGHRVGPLPLGHQQQPLPPDHPERRSVPLVRIRFSPRHPFCPHSALFLLSICRPPPGHSARMLQNGQKCRGILPTLGFFFSCIPHKRGL